MLYIVLVLCELLVALVVGVGAIGFGRQAYKTIRFESGPTRAVDILIWVLLTFVAVSTFAMMLVAGVSFLVDAFDR